MGEWLLPVVVFAVATGGVLWLSLRAVEPTAVKHERQVGRRLKELTDATAPADSGSGAPALIKGDAQGPFSIVDQVASRTHLGSSLRQWIQQSGVTLGMGSVIAISLVAGGSALLVTSWFTRLPWALIAATAAGATLPFLELRRRRTRRFKKLEEQLPEALDLMARAIRAGRGFTHGLQMVADEGTAPIGREFRKTFDEQNYGLPIQDALGNLSQRVPSVDVKIFVTAVIIQRETGGNLAEILAGLAHVVRERFKILRQVRVRTAHGRLTGYVLLGLPAMLAVALMVINPDHMALLFHDQTGHQLLLATVVLQTIGYFWIKKVMKIEV